MRKYLAAFFYFDNLLTCLSRMCGVNALYLVDATIQKFYGKDYVLRCGLTAIILRIEIFRIHQSTVYFVSIKS